MQHDAPPGASAAPAGGPVELVVGPRIRALEGFDVNRVWPTARRRLIGPFIFLDHLLPAELEAGRGFDVPPHPHIGLATVTYLFEGELMHRDSLGTEALIRPGELNWMTAGRGITHSERSSEPARRLASRLHGIQIWVALPGERENDPPSFVHYPAGDLPRVERPGAALRVIAGAAFGCESPVRTASGLFYAEADLEPGARLALGAELGERAVYVVSGAMHVGGQSFESGRLAVLANGHDVELEAVSSSKLMLIGGEPLEGPRHIEWNFVSSSRDRIDRAIADWRAERFDAVPGEVERMPLPGAGAGAGAGQRR